MSTLCLSLPRVVDDDDDDEYDDEYGIGKMVDPKMVTKGSTSSGVAYPHKWANILTAPLSEGAGMSYVPFTIKLRG